MQKTCSVCKLTKEVSEFSRNRARYDGLQTYCKACMASRDADRYKAGRRTWQERNATTRLSHRRLLWDYLLTHPCVDCGEPDPIVLEFDHVHGEKVMDVSTMARRLMSKKRLLEEIAKCEVRCANCHRKRTARTLGWYKDFIGS